MWSAILICYWLFSITEETGKLYITQSPDREHRDRYVLRVKVTAIAIKFINFDIETVSTVAL